MTRAQCIRRNEPEFFWHALATLPLPRSIIHTALFKHRLLSVITEPTDRQERLLYYRTRCLTAGVDPNTTVQAEFFGRADSPRITPHSEKSYDYKTTFEGARPGNVILQHEDLGLFQRQGIPYLERLGYQPHLVIILLEPLAQPSLSSHVTLRQQTEGKELSGLRLILEQGTPDAKKMRQWFNELRVTST